MPWQTSTGYTVLHAWEASGKPYSKLTENDKEWINKYENISRVCTDLDVRLIQKT